MPETPENAAAETTHPTLPYAVQIRVDAKKQIRTENPTIRERVVEQLVEAEIVRRTDLLSKAFAKRETKQKEYDRIKPDQEQWEEHDSGPKLAAASFSKAKVDERKKLREEIGKIDKAIAKCLDEADFESITKHAS